MSLVRFGREDEWPVDEDAKAGPSLGRRGDGDWSQPVDASALRAEGAAAERALLADWFAAIADMARDIDPFVSRAADFAANAVSLGRLGPPPGATNDPATARATKPATPWTLEAFRTHREPRS